MISVHEVDWIRMDARRVHAHRRAKVFVHGAPARRYLTARTLAGPPETRTSETGTSEEASKRGAAHVTRSASRT
eukprot:2033194-Pleurochrysis_carterae.AAC.1